MIRNVGGSVLLFKVLRQLLPCTFMYRTPLVTMHICVFAGHDSIFMTYCGTGALQWWAGIHANGPLCKHLLELHQLGLDEPSLCILISISEIYIFVMSMICI